MVIAGGVVEVTGIHFVNRIVEQLNGLGLEIDDVDGEHIRFQIERDNMDAVKTEIDFLRRLDSIRNVYVTYYSLEGNQDGKNEQSI